MKEITIPQVGRALYHISDPDRPCEVLEVRKDCMMKMQIQDGKSVYVRISSIGKSWFYSSERARNAHGNERKIIFLSGGMTGDTRYHEKFFLAQCMLQRLGYIVINPAVLPADLEYEQAMRICFTCIDVSDAICLLPDYLDSNGSSSEYGYAMAKGKEILFYEDLIHGNARKEV